MRDAIVLLPGLQSDRSSWVNQIAQFKADHDVIVPEGHHGLASIEAMADHVLAQLPERFHLVAWSMGGYIALEMLPKIHKRLDSLVLISTSARPEDPGNTARRLENLALAETQGMAEANDRSLAFSCHDIGRLAPEVRTLVRQAAVDLGVDAFRAQQHAIIGRADTRPNLAQVNCPARVIVGENDGVTPPDRARELHALIKGSALDVLPDCGHCAPLEFPEKINALLEATFRTQKAVAQS